MTQSGFLRLAVAMLTLLFIAAFSLTISPIQAQILGTNWTGEFYNNTTLSGDPVATGVDYPTGICFNWAKKAPTAGTTSTCQPGDTIDGVGVDNFSAIFISTPTFDQAGNYTFTLRFNDGLRFYIDGVLLYNNFTDTPDSGDSPIYVEAQVSVFLAAGDHVFRAEYVEFTGEAIIQIQWGFFSPPGETPTPGPANELLWNNGFEGFSVGDQYGEIFPWVIPTTSVGVDEPRCDKPWIEKFISHNGECAFRFSANLNRKSNIQQYAELNGSTFASGDSLDFTFWLNAKKADASVKAKVLIKYGDGTEPTRFKLELGQTDGYELIEENILLASAAVIHIRVQFFNNSAKGKIYLDDVSLLLITGGGSAILPMPLSSASDLTGSQP